MTLEEVTCEDLEKTREQLVSVIARELTIQERQFEVQKKGQARIDGSKTGIDAATVTSQFLENVASQGLSSMRVALPLVGVKVPRMW
jgi:hypothetical protein